MQAASFLFNLLAMLLYKPENEQSGKKNKISLVETVASVEEVGNYSSIGSKLPREKIQGKINESFLENPETFASF